MPHATQPAADLAVARARTEPAVLRKAAAKGWQTRWTALVSVSVQSALPATLVDDGTSLLDAADGPAPLAVDVWLNSRTEATTAAAPPSDGALPASWRGADAAEATPHHSSPTAAPAAAPAAQALIGSAVPPQPSALQLQSSAPSPRPGLPDPGHHSADAAAPLQPGTTAPAAAPALQHPLGSAAFSADVSPTLLPWAPPPQPGVEPAARA